MREWNLLPATRLPDPSTIRMKTPRALPFHALRMPPRLARMARYGRACASAVPVMAAAAPLEHSTLAPAGIQAEHIVRLWNLTLVVCGVVFASVLVCVSFALLRRRGAERTTAPNLAPYAAPERRTQRAVVGASALSVVLLVGLIVADVSTDRALSKLPVSDALHIDLTGGNGGGKRAMRPTADAPHSSPPTNCTYPLAGQW